jgi:molybdenum cofactor biosynthesis protein B
MSYEQHVRDAAGGEAARCAVVTLSDTRASENDTSGQRIRELLTGAGHAITDSRLIRDDAAALDTLLSELLSRQDVDVILTNGGTGVSRRDATVPVIQRRLDTPLPGFGELFRMLSWEQIGSGAMLSRALGGVASGKLLFAMPGSTKAVELAVTRLILPELKHLLRELRK